MKKHVGTLMVIIAATMLTVPFVESPTVSAQGEDEGDCSSFHCFSCAGYDYHASISGYCGLDHSHPGEGGIGTRTNYHEDFYIPWPESALTGCPYGDHSACGEGEPE